jgi:hypothetical protein
VLVLVRTVVLALGARGAMEEKEDEYDIVSRATLTASEIWPAIEDEEEDENDLFRSRRCQRRPLGLC